MLKAVTFPGYPFIPALSVKSCNILLDEAESQRMTDNGNPEHVRFDKIQNGLIIEYLNEADYKSPLADEIIDNILYVMIRKAQRDRRQHLFFGKGLDHPKYRIIKRFNSKEKPIPFQLLPKYAGLIRKLAKAGTQRRPARL